MRVLRIYQQANNPRHRGRERALADRGVEIGLVVPERFGLDWDTVSPESEFPTWSAPLLNANSMNRHLWRSSIIRRAIHEFAPDVVDVHEEPYFPAGLQAAIAASDLPLVMFSAQNIIRRLPPPFGMVQRWVLGRTDACYVCNTEAVGVLRHHGFTGHIAVVPLGVDPELFDVRPVGDRIGFIGRFLPEKGVEDILAFGSRLLMVGDGPLEARVRASGAEVRRVRTARELASALAEMAVLVAPSRATRTWKEQFGRVLVEAMAAGVPVVAYDTGSYSEVLSDCGVLVPEGDVAGLHQAVKTALRAPAPAGLRGRERVRSLYTWDRVADLMIPVYAAAMSSRAGRLRRSAV